MIEFVRPLARKGTCGGSRCKRFEVVVFHGDSARSSFGLSSE